VWNKEWRRREIAAAMESLAGRFSMVGLTAP
jgi:hypothetical protein